MPLIGLNDFSLVAWRSIFQQAAFTQSLLLTLLFSQSGLLARIAARPEAMAMAMSMIIAIIITVLILIYQRTVNRNNQ